MYISTLETLNIHLKIILLTNDIVTWIHFYWNNFIFQTNLFLSFACSLMTINLIILFSYIRISLLKGLIPGGLPVKILKALVSSSVLATCPAYLNLTDLIKMTIFRPTAAINLPLHQILKQHINSVSFIKFMESIFRQLQDWNHINIKHNNIVNLPWYTSWWNTGCIFIL